MATITVVKPALTATAMGAGTACAVGGDVVPNDGKTLLRFTNTDGSPVTVTFDNYTACNYGTTTAHDVTAVVAATTGDVVIGPFPKSRFDNASEQIVLTYTAVTALKIWAWSVA